MNDRNKTALTHRVTAVAAAALDGLGCKPVETEVPILPGWIADVASYWYPTRTEAKSFGMQKISLPARLVDAGVGDDLDMAIRCWGPGPLTVLAEVKTTVDDFRCDRKWFIPHPAHVCIVVFPSGVVSEVPKGWYGLEVTASGDKVRRWHRNSADIHPQHPGLVLDFVAQVGIRRDHRTRYAALRDFSKAYRAKDADKKRRYSAARLLESLHDWLRRKQTLAVLDPNLPFDEVLATLGIKTVPRYLDETIAFFESLRER